LNTPNVIVYLPGMEKWETLRREFPVTENYTYLNTAAAGPLSIRTATAAQQYYQQMMTEGDARWDEWLAQRESVREKVAKFINAEPDEIALTTNTSSGMNVIVDALLSRGEVISCNLEFPVTTLPWMHRRIPVHLVKARDGILRIEDLEQVMTWKTAIISVSHVQFSNGFRINLEELSRCKREHLLVVNASQSAGAFEIDVKRMGIDALCATGHKWMLSGYGSGFVYLQRELMAETMPHAIGWLSVSDPYAMRNDEIHLRHDLAARTEIGCPHFAGIFALGASIDQLSEIGIGAIERRVLELNQMLTKRLRETGWNVVSPLGDETFRSAETLVEVSNPAAVVARLAERRVIVTEKPQGLRVATDFYNNEEDIERLMAALQSVRHDR
jgi:selenocysteine lyase/cysteine desulfurase